MSLTTITGPGMVAVNEQRRRLHGYVAEAPGTEAADMLLDERPPVAWSDMAT